ncbi:DUF3772 domain-containing protein [Aliisedimentitalea scapharcae]|uniref:DUF3772 domain-containing protein n=2 Tax=Aliisedimentitalea scapharcae TaxID=1524259 RepID=A0ABZ2Y0D2_9RHOB
MALVVFTTSVGFAEISQESRSYYQEWLKTSDRAEDVIDAGRASESAFEVLRRDLVEFRQDFHEARTRNNDRIVTLKAQLAALGPEPETGDDSADIATLRASLKQKLLDLEVPQIISEEAYNHANGLISEIDKIIRARREAKLLQRGPSPLNPEHWPQALKDLKEATSGLWNELTLQASTHTTRERVLNRLPPILGLLVLSLWLIFRSKLWAQKLGDYLRGYGGSGTGVWSFVVSLVQMALPFVGVVLLTQAISLTGALSVRGSLILDSVPFWALTLLGFHWLSDRLLTNQLENDLIPIQEGRRSRTRVMIESLAIVLVLQDALGQLLQFQNISDATRAVLFFPLVLLSALILLGLHRNGLRQRAQDDGATAIVANANRLIRFLRGASYLLAYLAPLVGALGYMNAAEAIIYPIVLTLALMASLLVIQRFLGDLYGWLSGKGVAARESLTAVLAGFVLASVALPILALIWGARIADLTEIWSKFLDGFTIGDVQISPTNFMLFAVIFAAGYMLTRLIQSSLRNSLLPKTRIDPGGQNAIVAGVGYIGIFLASLIAITWAGFDLSSIAIVAGALSVGIGFGLQTIVSNFVSGIILLVERPISKGDWIEVNGLMGYVRDISVRSTRIETFDRSDIIVPNSDLITGTVTNYTRGNTVGRVIVPVGVAYGTDPRKVEKILQEIATGHPMVLNNPAPSVVFQGFGADSLDFEIRAILRDVNWVLSVRSDMNYEISQRFTAEGIEIPFAQRDVWLRNPEALGGRGSSVSEVDTQSPLMQPDADDLGAVAEQDPDSGENT